MGLQYDKMMGILSPADRERILQISMSWGIDPDSPEFIPFALCNSSLLRIEAIHKLISDLTGTIPQQHQAALETFKKTLSEHSSTIEKIFTQETKRRSEEIAEAVGVRLNAILADSRAPLVANVWLSVVVGFAACSGTLAVFWIVYRIPEHGWLALAMATAAVLAQWGKSFCRWFKDLVYRG
jgi:hypothetical protein